MGREDWPACDACGCLLGVDPGDGLACMTEGCERYHWAMGAATLEQRREACAAPECGRPAWAPEHNLARRDATAFQARP